MSNSHTDVVESAIDKRHRLMSQYPDYCTVTDAATKLGVTKRAVRHHIDSIKTIVVEGWVLYNRKSLGEYAALMKDNSTHISRFRLTGIDVERIQRICETYYRTQLDKAPPELLNLAKRVAKL